MPDIFRKPRAGPARLMAYLVLFPGLALLLNAWVFAGPAAGWAADLANPAWAPPGPVIGAVWVVLFALMGVSLWLVERAGQLEARDPARALILAQYAVSLSWVWFYFARQSVENGFYVTVVAWALAIAALIAIWRANRAAALFFLPLNVWLTLALFLSYSIWQLNA